MTTEGARKPDKKFRAGNVSIAIWRTEEVQDGQTETRFSIRIQKQYRDKDTGEWKTTEYLFPDELPKLRLVADKAFEYIALDERTNESDEQ